MLSALLVLCLTLPLAARELPRMPAWISARGGQDAPVLSAQSAILIDYDTGAVLYEKRADTILPPASLTKIMTIHLVLELARDGAVSLEEDFAVPAAAWARNQPPRSSLMFLGPGQHVNLRQLIVGLAVASGNDAAVAVALRLAGSVPAFVEMMNSEARRLGYEVMRFSDPAGLSPRNAITAREYADFIRHHLQRWPEVLDEIYSKREIIYPTADNFNAAMIGGSVRQENRNNLLFDYDGVDGLKTGYIHASGYNLAVTARRGDRRLIAVVLGVRAPDVEEGSLRRARDASMLLDYGFERFSRVEPQLPTLNPVRVWKGRGNRVDVVARRDPRSVVVPRGHENSVEVEARLAEERIAPVERGQQLGTLSYRVGDTVLGEIPLVSAARIERAGFLKRVWHTLVLMVRRVLAA
jgi:D-alanyl-D-alanine carboxypeptidase (penicillin-binding protein 5/6)